MGKDTRERILMAALEQFSQKGYEGTNIRELTASLGLVKSAMYRHFESKEAIWNALLDEMIAYYESRFGSPENLPPVPSSLEELVAMTLRMVDFTVRDERVIMTRKLLSIGLRPINNVVDISNFILFETGQPLHTFDADKIRGGKVIVRRAAQNEVIVTLDGQSRKLDATDMVIADAEGPMCIAGVFGGEDSGVTLDTVNVFVEGAYFDPASIRKTAKRHQLSTDASFRFERGADPEAALYAAKRAALLILELAGGSIAGSVREVCPEPILRKRIDLDYDRIEHFIGKKIGHDTIEKILTALNYEFVERHEGGALVAAPTYMVDVYRECDVVEEILRIYGYNNIELPRNLRMSVNATPSPEPEAIRNNISNLLASNGFVETMNNSLTKEEYYRTLTTFPVEHCVRIVNPLSQDLNVMRQTLILNGLEVIAYNINRQVTSLKTFEYGSVYQRLPEKDGQKLEGYEEHQNFALFLTGASAKVWRTPVQKSDFFQLKGYVELILKRYRVDPSTLQTSAAPSDIFSEGLVYTLPGKEPQVLCTLGTVNPVLAKRFGIKQPVNAILEAAEEHDVDALVDATLDGTHAVCLDVGLNARFGSRGAHLGDQKAR